VISFLQTKRWHVDADSPEVTITEKHVEKLSKIWRFLKLPETPQAHLVFVHSIRKLKQTGGMGDNGEDAVERDHQRETKNEK
jgi:hypothetical protein